MELAIGIDDLAQTRDDDLLSLRDWLLSEEGFRGRVALTDRPPAPGTLGSTLDAVIISLSSGLTSSAVMGVVVAWLQSRTGKLTLRIKHPNGEEREITAEGVRGLTGSALSQRIDEFRRAIDGESRPERGPVD